MQQELARVNKTRHEKEKEKKSQTRFWNHLSEQQSLLARYRYENSLRLSKSFELELLQLDREFTGNCCASQTSRKIFNIHM